MKKAAQFFSVQRRFQLFYLIQFAGVAIFMPYIALYLIEIGMSGAQVGILLGSMPLASFLVQPLWGLVSDIYGLRRVALTLGCLGVAIGTIIFGLVNQFRWLLLITLILSIIRSPIHPIITALALDYLEKEDRSDQFGSLRLWGSIGFIVTSFLIGGLIIGPTIKYIIQLYAIVMFILAAISLTLPDAPIDHQASWQEGLTLLRRQPNFLTFLLGALFVGMTLGVVNQYLALYLKDIHAAGWMIGVAFGISALPEVPLMALVPRMLNRWGLPTVLLGCLSLLPIRWLLYMQIENPWWVLPTQLLHGVALTGVLVVAVIYVDRLLARHWRATGQSLYTATQFGIGPSLGLFAAGYLYEFGGASSIWLFCTIIGVIGVVIVGWSMQMSTLSPIAERS
ncbi:MAG: MFS transporter [Chloroflexota bacterium]